MKTIFGDLAGAPAICVASVDPIEARNARRSRIFGMNLHRIQLVEKKRSVSCCRPPQRDFVIDSHKDRNSGDRDMRNWYLFLAFVLLAAITAQGHHSFAAEFDDRKPVSLRGTLTKVDW